MPWITNLQHYLDKNSNIAPSDRITRPLVDYFGAITTFATSFDEEGFIDSNISCRRRPSRKPCEGKIQAILNLDTDHILWRCPVCEDNGVISGWRDTPWDAS